MNTLRIFVSSPGDVAQERALTERIIQSLQGRFMGYVKLEPVFWEHEPLLASSSFQSQIILPSQTDIVVCILWSRLGTRLPANITRADGSFYASGTEFEFEDAMNAYEKNGTPSLLVYNNTKQAVISLEDEQLLLDKMAQKKSLNQFIKKWFFNTDGSIKSAFHTYEEIDDFESKIEQHLQVLIENKVKQWGLTTAQADFDSSTQLTCPYRGLEAFHAEHQNLFFGRTREIHEIIEALLKQAADNRAFLLILGASGSGKSSLLRAGVIPMLTRTGVVDNIIHWRQALMRPADSEHGACYALVEALVHSGSLPELGEYYPNLNELARSIEHSPDILNVVIQRILTKATDDLLNCEPKSTAPRQARLLLLVDQFEELFTAEHINDEDRQNFLNLIDTLARGGVVWIMTTLRSDFYGRVAAQETLTRLKEGHGQYDLLPPKPTQIAQMIRQPALFGGLLFEQDTTTGVRLDEVLLDSATSNPNALPLLSFTLEALYKEKTKNAKMTFAAYRALGGLEGALAKRAESTFNQLDESTQAALPHVLAQLVQVGVTEQDNATRRRCVYDPKQWSQNSKLLVAAFVDARLFVSQASSQTLVAVTIAHEALTQHWPRLRDWVKENYAALQIQRHITTATSQWQQGEKDASFLITGNRLSEVDDWIKNYVNRLNEHEAEFVQLSIALRAQQVSTQKEREQRELNQAKETARRIALRNKWLSGVGVSASILAMVATSLYFQAESQRQNAVTARNDADGLVGFMIQDLSLKLEEVGRLDILTLANEKATAYMTKQDTQTMTLAGRLRQIELFSEIGYVQQTQRKLEQAQTTYQTMLKHSKKLVSEYPDSYQAILNLIVSHYYVGNIHLLHQANDSALDSFRKQQATALAMLAKWPNDPEALDQLGLAYSNVGAILNNMQKYDAALSQFEKAVDISRQLLQQTPQDEIKLSSLADNYVWLGKLLAKKQQLTPALGYFNQAIQILDVVLDRTPKNTDNQYNLALALQWRAFVNLSLKRYEQAISTYQKSRLLMMALVNIDDSNIEWQNSLNTNLTELADVLALSGDYGAAGKYYQQAKTRLEILLAKNSNHQGWLAKHAKTVDKLTALKIND